MGNVRSRIKKIILLAWRTIMRRTYIGMAVTIFCISALVGCTETGRTSSAAPTTTAQPKAPPVVYDRRLDPQPLTDKQLKEIVEEATAVAPEGRKIWYVHVHYNQERDSNDGFYCNATVFYTPSEVTPRLRRGQSYRTSNSAKLTTKLLILRKLNEVNADSQPADKYELLGNYVQVSLQKVPFGKSLDTPTYRLWPFTAPEGFTDAELIELVDFARTSLAKPRTQEDKRRHITYLNNEFNGQEPIYSIKKLGDGRVRIQSGTLQGPLAGAGSFMECIKKDGQWIVLVVGVWCS